MKIHGTAKGGAISKKDFGVAFGGGAAPVTCSNTPAYDDTTGNIVQALYASDKRLQQGCKAISGSSLIGQKVTTATFKLLKVGSPTGTAVVTIYSDAVNGAALSSVLETSSSVGGDPGVDSLDVSTLTTSGVDYEFDFTGDTTIAEDNAIILVYTSSSSDSSNYIANNMGQPGSPVENTTFNYQKDQATAVWESETGFECRIKLCG